MNTLQNLANHASPHQNLSEDHISLKLNQQDLVPHLNLRILKEDLFEACHSVVDPEPYYQNCVYDTCGCDMGGDCMCYCESIETYMRQCNLHKININWRPKTKECRKHYSAPFY